jgi:hypothetical protein
VNLPASSALRVLGIACELGDLLGKRAMLERSDRVDDCALDANASEIRHAQGILLEACAAYATSCRLQPGELATLALELYRLTRA